MYFLIKENSVNMRERQDKEHALQRWHKNDGENTVPAAVMEKKES